MPDARCLTVEHTQRIGKGARECASLAEYGHMAARSGTQQCKKEQGGEPVEVHRLREVALHVVSAERHHGELCLVGSKRLFNLLGERHHTGVGPGVAGTIVAHKQYF